MAPRWKTRPHRINLFPPQRAAFSGLTEDEMLYCKYGCCAIAKDVRIEPVDSTDAVQQDGETYEVVLRSPHAGLHRVEVIDGGDRRTSTGPRGCA